MVYSIVIFVAGVSSLATLEHNLSIIKSASYSPMFHKMISLHIFQARGNDGVVGCPGVKQTLQCQSGECDPNFVYVDGKDTTYNVSVGKGSLGLVTWGHLI